MQRGHLHSVNLNNVFRDLLAVEMSLNWDHIAA
jgi:hypothetical protein